jgi:transposase
MRENDWTRVLGWPGYRVYQHEINEPAKTLKLWVRRKRGNRKLVCSGCGRKLADAYDSYEREVRDLPCFEYRTTVVVELYRVRCPDCGLKGEKVPLLPSKAPFSKRFEDAVGLACESAAVRRVARAFGLAATTVRDMWAPFRQSIEQWATNCRIVYDKFHIMQHAASAVDEVRRAEFFRKGGAARQIVKGKRWLLLTRWIHLNTDKKRQLNELFALNRRVMKAYLLKESLDRLWNYTYEGAMLRYLKSWIEQLRWQRLKPMEKLARMLLDHLEGILSYCRTKVRLGVVEAVNGNIKALLRRGRGYRDLNYLLLKAQRLAATKTQFIVLQKAA